MKIIREPSVYVIARQQIDDTELNRFLADHDVTWESDSEVAAEVVSEVAGRVCYMSFAKPRPGGNAAYLGHIKEVGHGSVCEHAVFSLIITGVSRSLTHELIRHRAGFGYSQLSQRYVDESVAEYVLPHDMREEHTAAVEFICRCKLLPSEKHSGAGVTFAENLEWAISIACNHPASEFKSDDEEELVMAGLLWLRSMVRASEDYRYQSDYFTKKAERKGLVKTEARKFARQAARSVLPNATETKLSVTFNARAGRHFLEQRGSQFAEPEIRKLANKMLDILQAEAPNLFGDYTRHPLLDGTFEIKTPYPKV